MTDFRDPPWAEATQSVSSLLQGTAGDDGDFVVLRHAGFYFAFRRYELSAHKDTTAPASSVLELNAATASPAVLVHEPEPLLNREQRAPASLRFVRRNEDGVPLVVVEPRGHAVLVARAAQPQAEAHEGSTIGRYPSIELSPERTAGRRVFVTIDLARVATDLAGDPITFTGLESDWTELRVTVRVSSAQLRFDADEDWGEVLVRRDGDSKKLHLKATVVDDHPDDAPISVTVRFLWKERYCGSCERTFGPEPGPESPGRIAIVDGAIPPDVCLFIHRIKGTQNRYHWLLTTSKGKLVAPQSAEITFDADPAAFTRAQFKMLSATGWQQHVALMDGLGKKLWELTPVAFRENYWALRDKLGEFSLQLVTDDPWLPWELMRPHRDGHSPAEGKSLLCQIHPVARGLLDYPAQLAPLLPRDGAIATMAPNYSRRTSKPTVVELPSALAESDVLTRQYGAVRLEPKVATFLETLEGKHGPIRVLHFAGHGLTEDDPSASQLVCEDALVFIPQVRRNATSIGERYKTLVILNACEAGATGEHLVGVGGWAEAFIERGFGGFVAPLWAVFDSNAQVVIMRLFELLLGDARTTVGDALRNIRASYGHLSPTFLSYVYYGDVNARFA